MKRWLIECTAKCGKYAVYSHGEPLCCYHCGMPAVVHGGFRKVKGIPVREVLARGIYRAPIM